MYTCLPLKVAKIFLSTLITSTCMSDLLWSDKFLRTLLLQYVCAMCCQIEKQCVSLELWKTRHKHSRRPPKNSVSRLFFLNSRVCIHTHTMYMVAVVRMYSVHCSCMFMNTYRLYILNVCVHVHVMCGC